MIEQGAEGGCAACEAEGKRRGANARAIHAYRCMEDPVHLLVSHARIKTQEGVVIPFDPYLWQRVVATDAVTNRLNIYLKSRGIGLSWLIAGVAVAEAGMKGREVLIGSRTEEVAIDLLGRAKFILDSIQESIDLPTRRESQTSIEFKLGGKIFSETASENMGRYAHPALFILDEWAFLEQDDKVTTSVMGAVGSQGRFVGFSTANGYGNQFEQYYHSAERGENGFHWRRLHWWDIGERDPRWRAIHDDAWYEEQKRVLNYDRGKIAQELDCDFLQSGHPVFDVKDLDEMWRWVKGRSLNTPRRAVSDERVIIGIDPAGGMTAGGGDDTSVTVLDGKGDEIWHEAWQKPIPEAQATLYGLLAQYTKPTIILERNALGLMYADALRKGPWTLVEIETTRGRNEEPPARGQLGRGMPMGTVYKYWWSVPKYMLITGLLADVQAKAFRAFSPETRFEMTTLARKEGDTYSAPGGMYDNRVMSLALARWGWRKGFVQTPAERRLLRPRSEANPAHFTNN